MKIISQQGYRLFDVQNLLCRVILLFQLFFFTSFFSQQVVDKGAVSDNTTVIQSTEGSTNGDAEITGSNLITITGDAFVFVGHEKKDFVNTAVVPKTDHTEIGVVKPTLKKKDTFFKKKDVVVAKVIKTAQPKIPSFTIHNPQSKDSFTANSSLKKNILEVKTQYHFIQKENIGLFLIDFIYRDLFSIAKPKFSKNLSSSKQGRAPPSNFS